MKKVKVLQVFRVRETGIVVHPGQTLSYPDDRADELAAGGWVAVVGDSEQEEPEHPAATNATNATNEATPPADGEGAASPGEEANMATTSTEAPPLPTVPEKQEIPAGQPEKAEPKTGTAKPGRKPKK